MIRLIHLLQRHWRSLAVAAVLLPVLAGIGFLLWPLGGYQDAFYTPGATPSREECAYAKLKNYKRVDKQILYNIAQDCELTVQSIEGHEGLRKAWEQRQAARETEATSAPAPAAASEPAQGDTLRRVWR